MRLRASRCSLLVSSRGRERVSCTPSPRRWAWRLTDLPPCLRGPLWDPGGGLRAMLRGIGKPKRTGGPGDSELACRSQQVRGTPRTAKGTQQPRTAREVQEPGAGAGDPAWVGGGAALRAWRRGAGAVCAARPLPSCLTPTLRGFCPCPNLPPERTHVPRLRPPHSRAPSHSSSVLGWAQVTR